MSQETRELAKNPKRLEELRNHLRRICYGDWKEYQGTEKIEVFRQYIKRLVLEDLFLFDYLVLSSSPEGTCRDIEYQVHYPGTLIIGKDYADDELISVLKEIEELSDGAFDYSPWIKPGTPLGLVAIEYPTGYFKTSAFKRGGALWLYLRNPEERQLIARETASLAFQDLEFLIQQVEKNEVFRWLFSEYIPVSIPKRWSKRAFDMPRQGNYGEPSFIALGVGGAIRGMHFTTIWLDDIHGERAIQSEAIMQWTIDWALNIATRLIGELNRRDELSGIFPKIRITQNRAAQWDVHTAFEEAYGEKFCYIRYKAFNSKWQSSYPKKYSTEELARKANSDNPTEQQIFWTQFMNNPQQSKITEFKREWLKFFDLIQQGEEFLIIDQNDGKQEIISLDQCYKFGWVDLATGKEAKRGSQTAIIIIAVAPNGKKYLIEAWRRRVSQPEVVNQIIKYHDMYKLNRLYIENYAEQSEFKEWLERQLRVTNRQLLVLLETPSSNKWNRIPDLIFYFKSGELRVRPNQREFMIEYESFPYLTICDILDALSASIPHWKAILPTRTKTKAIFLPIMNKTTGV